MSNYYKIADLNVQMDTWGRTKKQAIPYMTKKQDSIDITIASNAEEIKELYPSICDDDAEYLSTGISFYKGLVDYNGFMLHSSAVVMNGKAYLFTADSGTGKSTHTSLWISLFGEKAYILNDDKPALRKIEGTWYAYGTPWSGKSDISVNRGVPIEGICILERGMQNEITEYKGINAIFDIYRQTKRPHTAKYQIKLLDLMDHLLCSVPIWKLKCNMEPEAAIVAYEAMSGQKWEGNK